METKDIVEKITKLAGATDVMLDTLKGLSRYGIVQYPEYLQRIHNLYKEALSSIDKWEAGEVEEKELLLNLDIIFEGIDYEVALKEACKESKGCKFAKGGVVIGDRGTEISLPNREAFIPNLEALNNWKIKRD